MYLCIPKPFRIPAIVFHARRHLDPLAKTAPGQEIQRSRRHNRSEPCSGRRTGKAVGTDRVRLIHAAGPTRKRGAEMAARHGWDALSIAENCVGMTASETGPGSMASMTGGNRTRIAAVSCRVAAAFLRRPPASDRYRQHDNGQRGKAAAGQEGCRRAER